MIVRLHTGTENRQWVINVAHIRPTCPINVFPFFRYTETGKEEGISLCITGYQIHLTDDNVLRIENALTGTW